MFFIVGTRGISKHQDLRPDLDCNVSHDWQQMYLTACKVIILLWVSCHPYPCWIRHHLEMFWIKLQLTWWISLSFHRSTECKISHWQLTRRRENNKTHHSSPDTHRPIAWKDILQIPTKSCHPWLPRLSTHNQIISWKRDELLPWSATCFKQCLQVERWKVR